LLNFSWDFFGCFWENPAGSGQDGSCLKSPSGRSIEFFFTQLRYRLNLADWAQDVSGTKKIKPSIDTLLRRFIGFCCLFLRNQPSAGKFRGFGEFAEYFMAVFTYKNCFK
jgi:hypothetical protein